MKFNSNKDRAKRNTEMFLEDFVYIKIIRSQHLYGIKGIQSIQYVCDSSSKNGSEWMIETYSSGTKKYNTFSSLILYEEIAFEKMVSTHIWNLMEVLGVEAARQHMIDTLMELCSGINYCHIVLIVDHMTFSGSILSMTRHTVLADSSNSGPIAVSTFETAFAALTKGASSAYNDTCKSVSAQIVIGADAKIGTNAEFELLHLLEF